MFTNGRAKELYNLIVDEARNLESTAEAPVLAGQALELLAEGIFISPYYWFYPQFKQLQRKIKERSTSSKFTENDLDLILSMLAKVFDRKLLKRDTYERTLAVLLFLLNILNFKDDQVLVSKVTAKIRNIKS